MRVKDVMTPNVIGIAETATLWDALEAFVRSQVSALVVFNASGAPVGVLSEGDLLRRAELGTQKKRPGWLDFLLGGRAARDYVHSHGRRAGELMTRGLVTIGEEAALSEAVDLMLERRIKRLIVMRDGVAVGVLSRADLLRALMSAIPQPGVERPDADIQAAVMTELQREAWTPLGSIRVGVAGGTVTLDGTISDEQKRDALRVLVENVAGVRSVRDRLAWIEPNSGYLIPGPEDERV